MIIPVIKTLPTTFLIGQKTATSLVSDKTRELWQSFSPRKKEIKNLASEDLYSVEIYPGPEYFQHFDPTMEFEKWAAVAVSDFDEIPEGMDVLTIPSGEYAVFHYRGKPSEVMETFKCIYGEWLPTSGFTIDRRPHFAVMGSKYKGEHPDSEEDFWIPIKNT